MSRACPIGLRIASLVFCLAAACADDGPREPQYLGDVDLPAEYRPRGDEFLVIVIPDSQIYSRDFPETFESQMRWIADHADEYRIAFVTHVGDVVQDGTRDVEWTAATAAYDWIRDIDLPHGFSPASHDKYDSAPGYLDHFGPGNYGESEWYRGASPSGFSSYQIVEAEGMRLLFMHIPQNPTLEEVEWASGVLDAHPGTLAHVTTHQYLYDYRLTAIMPVPLNLIRGGRFDPLVLQLADQEIDADRLISGEVFDMLVANHPNVWGIHCGHVDAEFRATATNDAGLTVHEILTDYQDMSDGGGGWLRVLRFKPSEDQIEVLTFSTVTGAVRQNGDGFDHAIGILEAYRGRVEGTLEDLGLVETVNTFLSEVNTEGHETRESYRSSLYDQGQRDSYFVLDVPFQQHIDAAQ